MNDPNDKLPPYFVTVGVLLVASTSFYYYFDGYLLAPSVGLLYIALVSVGWGFIEGIRWLFPTNRWSDLWHPERRSKRGSLPVESRE